MRIPFDHSTKSFPEHRNLQFELLLNKSHRGCFDYFRNPGSDNMNRHRKSMTCRDHIYLNAIYMQNTF